MCLDKIWEKAKVPKSGSGCKVVVIGKDGNYYPTDQGAGKPFEKGKWIKEFDYREYCYKDDTQISKGFKEFNSWINNHEESYPFGFHILKSKISKKISRHNGFNFKLIKVFFRKAHTLGTQDIFKKERVVIVAREIFIPKEE